ncbi:DUF4326 domain-containing protein [Kribbella sp. NPDC051587]|uniref:DUF4326 domain-containing protein n=1 Tax=Kribbella sp. NPDC051587 TaxID=3364119 RepID=UPI0037951F21
MKRPTRIQQRPTPGWATPEGSVMVDRSSRWGNPFRTDDLLGEGAASTQAEARTVAVHRFGRWLDGEGPDEYAVGTHRSVSRSWMRAHLEELIGKVLVCTCPMDEFPCHADELARRAAERAVYVERAQLVAYMAAGHEAVLSVDSEEPACPDVIYVPTLEGQLSWHLEAVDVERHFDHVPHVSPDDPAAAWDRHDTPEKYRRVARLTARVAQARKPAG